MAPRTREEALRSLYQTKKRPRNREPGWAWSKKDLEKLSTEDLCWLADFEAAADEHKPAAARIGMTEEVRSALSSMRYSRDEYLRNRPLFKRIPEFQAERLLEAKAKRGEEICPFTPGKAKEAK
jgi:hypothetical protein